jgi:hypothetical protein
LDGDVKFRVPILSLPGGAYMPSMEPLSADSLRSLQIVPSAYERAEFRFYEIFRGPYVDEWDVVGVRQLDATLLDIRLMHVVQAMIEHGWGYEEAPEWPLCNTLHEAPGYLALDPAEMNILIQFFEGWLDGPGPSASGAESRFRAVEASELLALHVLPARLNTSNLRRGWYRYLPDDEIPAHDEISLVRLPQWFPSIAHQVSVLGFVTFSPRRLDDPTFDPLEAWGLGRIILNQPALREMITLLKAHTLEYSEGGSQS